MAPHTTIRIQPSQQLKAPIPIGIHTKTEKYAVCKRVRFFVSVGAGLCYVYIGGGYKEERYLVLFVYIESWDQECW